MEFLKSLGADMSLSQVIEMMLRVVLAAVCGGIVGIERSRRFKDAGVRTHCMVACASAVMMIISKYGFMDLIDGARGADPSRVAAGIVTGVGFLGAGMIYRDRHQSLKGLTTAAGLWSRCRNRNGCRRRNVLSGDLHDRVHSSSAVRYAPFRHRTLQTLRH